jgi:hypothetical protein
MSDIFDIHLSLKAKKDLKKVPLSIAVKLQIWVDAERKETTLNTSEYCLSSYIYTINKSGLIKFVEIKEVNKHEY